MSAADFRCRYDVLKRRAPQTLRLGLLEKGRRQRPWRPGDCLMLRQAPSHDQEPALRFEEGFENAESARQKLRGQRLQGEAFMHEIKLPVPGIGQGKEISRAII